MFKVMFKGHVRDAGAPCSDQVAISKRLRATACRLLSEEHCPWSNSFGARQAN